MLCQGRPHLDTWQAAARSGEEDEWQGRWFSTHNVPYSSTLKGSPTRSRTRVFERSRPCVHTTHAYQALFITSLPAHAPSLARVVFAHEASHGAECADPWPLFLGTSAHMLVATGLPPA